MEIANSICVISGGGSGLGEATAKHLASLGAKIAILDHNKSRADAVAKSISGLAFQCDVTDINGVTEAIFQIEKSLGCPQVCVNCAGIAPAARMVGKTGPQPLEDFAKVINVNLIGTFNVMRLVAHRMSLSKPLNDDGEQGVIINTASIAAFEGQVGQAAYSASKGGIVAMTLPVARELSRFGIRVMTIAPGLMQTPMMEELSKVNQSLHASIPFPKRLGHPLEYAKLVLQIIENPLLNGETIRLDGALRLN